MNGGQTHQMILGIINEKASTRAEIASFYANGIARWYVDQTSVDFAILNRAILGRYSRSGLTWIKREAWKHFQARNRKRG